ncbi:MAG: DUF433 domain-containing protein [Microcoleus sp. CSU_2_2]|nr:DUF433 domain-containing protein [Microcoleus sp. SU_5_3]NJS09281.1 DUF433 domain-containing protein [Microcoleus sp. CSU_2_2]
MKLDRITSNPNRINGQPCIRNLRLTVRRVIELLATYPDREELHREFPELEDEDIRQAIIFVSSYMDDRIIELQNHYETNLIKPDRAYPVWSPYDAVAAADTMLKVLEAAKNQNHV